MITMINKHNLLLSYSRLDAHHKQRWWCMQYKIQLRLIWYIRYSFHINSVDLFDFGLKVLY